jgi:hypothetical protein
MTPAGERKRLAVRAKDDPSQITRVRDRGRRGLRRGAIAFAISALSVGALLGFRLNDPATGAFALGFCLGLLYGAGALFVGWRRVALANGAQRLLDQARVPVARVHRELS